MLVCFYYLFYDKYAYTHINSKYKTAIGKEKNETSNVIIIK